MLDYILKNKEWLFSGIGVTFIGLLLLFIRYLFKKKTPRTKNDIERVTNNITKAKTNGIVHVSAMSQEDVYRIIQELKEMPPLHIEDITKNYVGLNVDLLTEYFSAYQKDADLIRVQLFLIGNSFNPVTVWCEVNLSEYKQFSILKKNAKIRVIGKIAKIDLYSVSLSNVKLFFLK